MKPSHQCVYARLIKRFLDILFSAAFLLILSPFLILFALLVALSSRGPVLFRQERLGQNGTVFQALKFRTMQHKPRKIDREILAGDPEVTAVGRFLRRFKFDELPQLWNLLVGDMSFIGPRPVPPEHLSSFNAVARKRLLVRPGLSGLAQVNGNIYLSWPQRWEYDARYVDTISCATDFVIFWKTLVVVLLGEKIYYKQEEQSKGKQE